MKTILVVEDDAPLRHAIGRRLTSAGYTVVATGDTMAALDELSSHHIDLLVTDTVMPKGNPHGIALARMARTRRANLPIVFVTGYDDVASDEVGLPGPIFHKPVDMDELLKAIGGLFEVSAAPA